MNKLASIIVCLIAGLVAAPVCANDLDAVVAGLQASERIMCTGDA